MKRLALLLLAVSTLAAGCIPVAMLRPAEPAAGTEFTVGGSALFGGGGPGAAVIPYFAVARGDGETEFNLSAQFGVRGGLKQRLGQGLSLDAGVTVPPFFILTDFNGLPVAVDAGVILGLEGFYISPRVQWLGFQIGNQTVSGLAYQVSLGLTQPGWIAEFGGMFNEGGAVFNLSAAVRF